MKKKYREKTRDRVIQTAGQTWGEDTYAVHLPKVSVEYHVPGRAVTGDIRSRRRVRRATRLTFATLIRLISFPLLFVIEIATGPSGTVTTDISSAPRRGRITVSGSREECSATYFGDSMRSARDNLWIVWSDTKIAVFQADEKNTTRFIWEGDRGLRPDFNNRTPEYGVPVVSWTWQDNSEATLVFSEKESDLMLRYEGIT